MSAFMIVLVLLLVFLLIGVVAAQSETDLSDAEIAALEANVVAADAAVVAANVIAESGDSAAAAEIAALAAAAAESRAEIAAAAAAAESRAEIAALAAAAAAAAESRAEIAALAAAATRGQLNGFGKSKCTRQGSAEYIESSKNKFIISSDDCVNDWSTYGLPSSVMRERIQMRIDNCPANNPCYLQEAHGLPAL
jgi:hypothetical protein